ncbi:hypothetical protein BELL_0360g00040 [Botrytis elliptica]|uniref:Uncharacterized protein n=1 Tax=Botrytis elliptica TaxID=278938 RepID=A0A4Z1JWZ8_9HELO|nr:hypothetical protein BELL_0360g00040 [Botrytis elliptica]
MNSYLRDLDASERFYSQDTILPIRSYEYTVHRKTNTPDGTTIKHDTINLLSTHDQQFHRALFFLSTMQCIFCDACVFTGHEICHLCGAYIPANRIVQRVRITEQPDKTVAIEHEKNVELWQPVSKSDTEETDDKPCMVVEVDRSGSLVSVVMNEKYVRVSMRHKDASCPAKNGPVEKAELWNVSGTTM